MDEKEEEEEGTYWNILTVCTLYQNVIRVCTYMYVGQDVKCEPMLLIPQSILTASISFYIFYIVIVVATVVLRRVSHILATFCFSALIFEP